MSSEPPWRLRVSGPASRKIAEVLPESVTAAVIEFVIGSLLENPHRVGRRLQRELARLHAARRGTFRVIYRIDDTEHRVEVIDVAHRAGIYRAGH